LLYRLRHRRHPAAETSYVETTTTWQTTVCPPGCVPAVSPVYPPVPPVDPGRRPHPHRDFEEVPPPRPPQSTLPPK
jgi:hypothetical protein